MKFSCIGEGVGGCRKTELGNPVDATQLLWPEIEQRVEPRDLAGEAHRKTGGVETSD
jgi:hypothetical protein